MYRALMVLVCMAFVISCEPSTFIGLEITVVPGNNSARPEEDRDYNSETRNVLLLYSAGFNSISSYLSDDIKDLMTGEIPSMGRMSDVLLIYSHLPEKGGAYKEDTSPVLLRVYKDLQDNVVRDTLVVYPKGVRSATPGQLNQVLTYVRDNYPATSYGMIFSSHATGYLPSGYYTNPRDYIYTPTASVCDTERGSAFGAPVGVPYVEPEHDPSLPMVKSVGQDQVGVSGSYLSYEIQIEDFARALPMYMDYILFDACLMGGVEVAYELSGRCGLVGFSQTEVLAEGFDYKTLVSHLLNGGTPDPEAVCDDYFQQYAVQSGIYQSATISLVDCSKMEPLAAACADLFEKYRDNITLLTPGNVQRYYRGDYHWFYDLVDIVAKAGAADDDVQTLRQAVNECIVYKNATSGFMGSFTIRNYSGFSMYLPCNGSNELDKYYRTLRWNIATRLVK